MLRCLKWRSSVSHWTTIPVWHYPWTSPVFLSHLSRANPSQDHSRALQGGVHWIDRHGGYPWRRLRLLDMLPRERAVIQITSTDDYDDNHNHVRRHLRHRSDTMPLSSGIALSANAPASVSRPIRCPIYILNSNNVSRGLCGEMQKSTQGTINVVHPEDTYQSGPRHSQYRHDKWW